ncbi:hypothetical protein Pan216_14510 [Planctomycetes bacterium Pan216]|uniref:Uncharacterized protein n=1 Tax=Kolteria novifilia TaxID=2527975 RepID=A0A518B0V0_9BACT|nr:hypothetical protein Pan216_14510 [Planctomycetes bacterium Pan216]
MDKVKIGAQFVWTHRFWFSIGMVALLAIITYPSGSARLLRAAEAQKKKLEGVYKDVSGFKSGVHPNPKTIAAAGTKNEEITGDVEEMWTKLYNEQQKLMIWPARIQQRFQERPFGADLSEDLGRYLIIYKDNFIDHVADIWDMLEPLRFNEEGEVIGKVDSPGEVISRAFWSRNPKSMEAWLAQEELWIQLAIVKVIREVNKNATGWKDAAVRELEYVGIGYDGIDSKSAVTKGDIQLQSKLELPENPNSGMPGDEGGMVNYGGRSTGGKVRGWGARPSNRGNQNIDPERYLEMNEQFRTVPVSVSMLVDQRKIPEILAALANADFHFHINQVSVGVRAEPVETPQALLEIRQVGESGVRDDAAFNSVRLQVWGVMRFYEMPPKMKEAYDAKANPQKSLEQQDQ